MNERIERDEELRLQWTKLWHLRNKNMEEIKVFDDK